MLANEKLQALELKVPGCTGRWDKIQKNKELNYKIVCLNEDNFNKREIIETTYAIKYKSLYWNLSPTQSSFKFINNIKIKEGII